MNFEKLLLQVDRFRQDAVQSSGFGGYSKDEKRPYNLGFITEGTHKIRILLDQSGEWTTPPTYYHNIKVPGVPDKYKRTLCADQFSVLLKRSAESCPICREVKLVMDHNENVADEANKIKLGGYNRYTREKIYKVFLYLHETTSPSDFWVPGTFHVAIINTRIWTALKTVVESNVDDARKSSNPEDILNMFNYEVDNQPLIQLQVQKGAGGFAAATTTRFAPELKLKEKIQADQLPLLTQVYVDSINGLKTEELARGSEEVKQIYNQYVVVGSQPSVQAQPAQPSQQKEEPSSLNQPIQPMNEVASQPSPVSPSVQTTPEVKPEVQAVNQPSAQPAPATPVQSEVAGDKPACYSQFNPTSPDCSACGIDIKRQCIVDTARKKSGM